MFPHMQEFFSLTPSMADKIAGREREIRNLKSEIRNREQQGTKVVQMLVFNPL
jgi:hypothetical protein